MTPPAKIDYHAKLARKRASNLDLCQCGQRKRKKSARCQECRARFGPARPEIEQPSDPSIRYIPLTRGQIAIVDAADYEWLSQWKWYAQWSKCTHSYYATRATRVGDRQVKTPLHRVLLGLPPGDSRVGDHRNGITLDNRRSNLRIVPKVKNVWNSRRPATNTSGYKGVSWNERKKKWQARIRLNGKEHHIGYFESPEAAHCVYSQAVKRLHGEFSRTE